MRIPPVFEERPPVGSGRDILQEERERRRGGLRRVTPGYWLSGRLGVFVLVVFILSSVSLVGFRHFTNPLRETGLPPEVLVVPEGPVRVRDLTVSEYSLAVSFGKPLFMGDAGRPVVEVESTGVVRSLTPVEMSFDSPFVYIPSVSGRIVHLPGPRGWGMWWRDLSEESSLRPRVSYDRLLWSTRQQDELQRAVRGVFIGAVIVSRMELNFWRPGSGALLGDLTAEIKEPYPPVRHGHWAGVPGIWFCDVSLDFDLYQGLSRGCPGDEYHDALSEAWVRVGVMVDRLERIGRLASVMDGMDSADFYLSNSSADMAYEIADMVRNLEDMEFAVGRLERVSLEWDLPVVIDLTGGY